jgi:hypothetical protein
VRLVRSSRKGQACLVPSSRRPAIALTLLLGVIASWVIVGCGGGGPICGRALIATWRDRGATSISLHQHLPPVTELKVTDITVGRKATDLWKIHPSGAPRALTVVKIGVAPRGYAASIPLHRSATTKQRAQTLAISVYLADGDHAVGLASSNDPNRQLRVAGAPASATCYALP